jgi:hypothetical protein
VPGDKRPFLRSSKWDRSCSHQNSVLGVGIHICAILWFYRSLFIKSLNCAMMKPLYGLMHMTRPHSNFRTKRALHRLFHQQLHQRCFPSN